MEQIGVDLVLRNGLVFECSLDREQALAFAVSRMPSDSCVFAWNAARTRLHRVDCAEIVAVTFRVAKTDSTEFHNEIAERKRRNECAKQQSGEVQT